jgi:ATP-dependent helicase/DNAse subunit B
MPVSLIVGPPNSGRVGEVVHRIRGVLDRDPVLVVPTADDTSRFERVLCEPGDAVVGASITTFSWLAEDVARALGVQAPPALSRPQRLALVRAAIGSTPLRLLRRSAERPGFAPALDALIAELQAALVGPEELAASASDLDGGDYEAELATLYRSYVGLRDRAERSDAASLAAGVAPALRTRPADWGGRPVFLYGFDDLTRVQLELVAALATAAEVTVAVTYDDRAALTARAGLLAQLTEELGAGEVARLEHRADYAESPLLAHLDSSLFEPEADPCPVDDGLRLLECAGALGEAEAIGVEIARLLAAGEAEPDEIVVVLRRPANGGELLGRVLRRLGIPVAVEAKLPLARTAVGRALIALCRAASPTGTPDDLLAHLRADPSFPAGLADRVERGIVRGEICSVDAVFESWESPPRHLARLRSARGASARLRALAAIARAPKPPTAAPPPSQGAPPGMPFRWCRPSCGRAASPRSCSPSWPRPASSGAVRSRGSTK